MLRLSRIVMLICPLVNQGFRQSSGGEKFPSPPPQNGRRAMCFWVVKLQIFFSFNPYLGKMIHFDDHIFQMWLKPPTRYSMIYKCR